MILQLLGWMSSCTGVHIGRIGTPCRCIPRKSESVQRLAGAGQYLPLNDMWDLAMPKHTCTGGNRCRTIRFILAMYPLCFGVVPNVQWPWGGLVAQQATRKLAMACAP